MTPHRRIPGVALLLIALLASPAGALESRPASAPNGSVRLVTPRNGAAPGTDITIGVFFTLDPGWHVYWLNPGESGEAPKLEWHTPLGYTAGPPEWPAPTRLVVGENVAYGYEHELLLPVRMRAAVPHDRIGADLEVGVSLTWLACRAEECIPAKAKLSLTIPSDEDATETDPKWSQRFLDADANAPRPAVASIQDRGDGIVFLSVPSADLAAQPLEAVEFFPRDIGVIDENRTPTVRRSRGALEIEVAKAPSAPRELTRLSGILTLGEGPARRAFAVETVANNAATGAVATSVGFFAAFAFAFLGGLLLNLMPCVFPVLSLKVLGFAERAHGDARRIRAHGWAFTFGVLLSFWALAGTLLAIRAGGEELGWGFQLQSPVFVALLSYLLFAMGLSLVGVFEVGTSLTRAGGRVGTEEGVAGSFWTGALATVVATPCTAPFMGPALGFALTQSTAVSMAIFTALGAGMASPYLVLSYIPALLSRLPRPGPWMERLRQLMAFPLFASAIWLAAVLAKQAGDGALVRLLAGALLLAFALWLWGLTVRSERGERAAKLAAVAVAALALAIGLGAARHRAPSAHATDDEEAFWQPWSPERVSELRAEGRGVFVNFTAAWCLTCQVNEGAIFARSEIRDLFDRYEVSPLEADWTNENPEIARTLAGFGRDGVPLYVFYPAQADRPPIVLPQVPTRDDLEGAFR